MSRFFTLLTLVTVLSISVPVFAQETAKEKSVSEEEIFCDSYMSKDSLQLSVESSVDETVPGSTMTFSGTVNNTNKFPIVGADLLVRVYQTGDTKEGVVVDQFLAGDNFTFKQESESPFTFTWKVPQDIADGTYYLAFEIQGSNKYTIISFAENISAGANGVFSVVNKVQSSAVQLNAGSLKLSGKTQSMIDVPVIDNVEQQTISVEITNPSTVNKQVPLQWVQYAWGNTDIKNVRNQVTKLVTLKAGETKTISYIPAPQSEGITEVVVTTQDGSVKTSLPFKFVKSGSPATEIRFAGIDNSSIKAGEERSAFACVKNLDESLTNQHSLSFTLKDQDGNTIHQSEEKIDLDKFSVGTKFTSDKNLSSATLMVALKLNGTTLWETETVYDCQALTGQSCGEVVDVTNWFSKYAMNILLGIVVLLLAAAVVIHLIKKRNSHIVALLIFGILFGGTLVSSPNVALATHSSSCVLGPEEPMNDADGFADMRGAYECQPYNYIDPAHGGDPSSTLNNVYVDCGTLGAGDTSPNGACLSRIQFSPSSGPAWRCELFVHECASAPPLPAYDVDLGCGARDVWTGMNCQAGEIVLSDCAPNERGWQRSVASTLSCPMNPFSHTGERGVCVADATCSVPTASCTYNINSHCINGKCKDALTVATSFGTGQAETIDVWDEFRVTATVGGVSQLFTTRCDAANPGFGSCTNSQIYTVNGTSIEIDVMSSFSLSGEMRGEASVNGCTLQTTGSPPTVPVIAGPTTGDPNFSYSFNFTSNDPDGDGLRYGVDWDNNGTVDEWLPGSGYASSNATMSQTYSWPTVGTYTFQALAEDDNGNASAWASHTITISVPVGPCTWNYRVKSDCSDIVDLWGNVYNTNWCTGGNFSLLPQCAAGLSAASDGQPAPAGSPLQCKLSDTEKLRKVGTSCTAGPAADLKINGSDVGITVTKDAPLMLDWTSTNAASCTLFGAGLLGGSVPLTGNSPIIATVSDNYILTCDGVSDQISVTVANRPPNAPTITHPTGNADFNINTTFSILGTDPDGDAVFYEIDWDNDGTFEAATASAGSGVMLTASHGWASFGQKTLAVKTVDIPGGLRSAPTLYTITVNPPSPPPNFTQPNITYTPGTFNTTTGMYDSVTIIFQTSNNGGSDTGTNANYRLEYDRGANGFEYTNSGALGTLTVGQSVNRTEIVTGGIPFGANRVRVTVDSDNNVVEADETDNVRTLDFTIGAPDPGLSITANPSLVQNNQNSTISWTVGNPYSMICSVFGPGMTTRNFNPATDGGSGNVSAGPITAKSEYTLSCTAAGNTFTDTTTVETQGVIEEI